MAAGTKKTAKAAAKPQTATDAIIAEGRNGRRNGFGGLRHAAGLIDKLTRPAIRKRGFAQGEILRNWADIVGPRLAGLTVPERVQYSKKQGHGARICVRVGGAAALELQHAAVQIVERINTYFGYRAISELKLIQAPVPVLKEPGIKTPRTVRLTGTAAAEIAKIEDPELAAALQRLGGHIYAKSVD